MNQHSKILYARWNGFEMRLVDKDLLPLIARPIIIDRRSLPGTSRFLIIHVKENIPEDWVKNKLEQKSFNHSIVFYASEKEFQEEIGKYCDQNQTPTSEGEEGAERTSANVPTKGGGD